MTQYTQHGVPANPEQKPQGKTLPHVSVEGHRSQANPQKANGRPKIAALLGSLIATALLGVFVFESGCSKESGKSATIAPPNQTVASQAPTEMLSVPASTSTTALSV